MRIFFVSLVCCDLLVKSRKSFSFWWGTALLQALSNGNLWRESHLSSIAGVFTLISRNLSKKLQASLHKLIGIFGDLNKQLTNQETVDVSSVPPFVILDILQKTEMAEMVPAHCQDGDPGKHERYHLMGKTSQESHAVYENHGRTCSEVQYSRGYSVYGAMIKRVVRCCWLPNVRDAGMNLQNCFVLRCVMCPYMFVLIFYDFSILKQSVTTEAARKPTTLAQIQRDPLAGQQLEISVDHLQCVMAACAGTWRR